MKKLLSSILCGASLLAPAPATASNWTIADYCPFKGKFRAQCYGQELPSNQQNYNNVRQFAIDHPSVQFQSGIALFESRDTPPSDSYMINNAQFERNDVFPGTRRIYITNSGDAYICEDGNCSYESAFSINKVFERLYRGKALLFYRYENFNGSCSLVRYSVQREKTWKAVVAVARNNQQC